MKRYLSALIVFIITSSLFMPTSYAQTKGEALKGRITISGAWALYPMAVEWAQEFEKVYPGIKIDISAGGAGKGITDVLSQAVDLGMVSRDINLQEVQKGIWALSVAKDAVVVTVNAANPVLKDARTKGISKDMFQNIFISGKAKTWGQVVNNDNKEAVHVYTRSDACGAAETWAKYLGYHQEDLVGIGVYGDPGVAEAVKNDKLAIGFNNINFAYDIKTKAPVPGIAVLEPHLTRELYFVTMGNPQKKEVRAFLHWVLTDGQKFVEQTGYMHVPQEKIKEDLQKLGV